MAIRRPNKPAEEFEPEELFDIAYGDGSGSPDFKGPLTDFRLSKDVNQTSSVFAGSRLQGTKYLQTAESEDESNASYSKYDYMDGWSDLGLASPNMSWMWRRAPGYFDVVTYVGTSTEREVPHNLGVAPEMMWVKSVDGDRSWNVYSKSIGNENRLLLNADFLINVNGHWNDTDPTDSVFTVDDDRDVNSSLYNYIAFLFASVPGICDIGSFTGNGGSLNIDCGFTNGARFVLIKRTDEAGDWMYFDTVRGINATGSSPHLALNNTEAEVTFGGRLNSLNAGFKVSSFTNPPEQNTNASGGSYIYTAIA
jgi:hypothetical protein